MLNLFRGDSEMVYRWAVTCFMTGVIFMAAGCSGKDLEGTGSISTENYANRTLEYYYFIPGRAAASGSVPVPFLICVPGLSQDGETFVFKETRQLARQTGWVIIAPSFRYDEMKWQSKTSYQYPSHWSGQALLDILKHFESQHGMKYSTLYLTGASAGAQFSLRFALWRPAMCTACAAYASGGSIEVRHPVDVDFLIGIGRRDTHRIAHAETFRDTAARYGVDVTYRMYDSDHALPAAFIDDSIKFFRDFQ